VHPANNIDDPSTTDIVENELGSNPSAIIGTNVVAPLTMAAAYAGLANHGGYCAPIAVESITDAHGATLPGQARSCSPAVAPEVAATTVYALENAMKRYGGNPRDGVPIFGKTGTTDDFDQTWLMSSTTAVTTAVWFGNVSGKFALTRYPSGINNRHIIAKPINATANALYPGGAFDRPSAGLVSGASIAVPDFVGGTPATAKAIIDGLGLVFADGGQTDSDRPPGVVVSTSPAPGSAVSRGSTVTVTMSNGALATVPELAGLSRDEAVDRLTTAGFAVGDQTCVVGGTDRVVSTNPAAGTLARKSDGVQFAVGRAVC
jgi:membrane peptidoglycan carboxypeptidase